MLKFRFIGLASIFLLLCVGLSQSHAHFYLQDSLFNSNKKPNNGIKINVDTIVLQPDTIKLVDTIFIFVEQERPDWTLIFDFAPFYPLGTYKALKPEYENTANIINKEFSPSLSYTFSSSINWSNNDWLINAGLAFTQIREHVSHSPTNLIIEEKEYEVEGILDEYYVVNGTDTTWYTTTTNVTYTYLDSNYLNYPYINRFSYLEIPVGIGREFNFGKCKAAFMLGWSISFNINNKHRKHLILNNNNRLTTLITDKKLNKSLIGFYTAVRLCYPVTEKINLIVRPYYLSYFENLFDKDYPFHKKVDVFGVGTGLSISF